MYMYKVGWSAKSLWRVWNNLRHHKPSPLGTFSLKQPQASQAINHLQAHFPWYNQRHQKPLSLGTLSFALMPLKSTSIKNHNGLNMSFCTIPIQCHLVSKFWPWFPLLFGRCASKISASHRPFGLTLSVLSPAIDNVWQFNFIWHLICNPVLIMTVKMYLTQL